LLIGKIIFFFIWPWFISPIDKISEKEGYEKNKRKVEVVKAVEKFRKLYENKFKGGTYNLRIYNLEVIDICSKIRGN
tara:strand:+ start:323 stop:553 length:231 start_codon:yes stop_codon:yes gene_type:complete